MCLADTEKCFQKIGMVVLALVGFFPMNTQVTLF
jgi:hypothetical membrane protein